MLDEVKFLRELPVLHGKIEMPVYKGVCTGVYLICENGMKCYTKVVTGVANEI